MVTYRGHAHVAGPGRGAVLAIGNLDGVHRGHAALLAQARARATALGVPAGALVFDPHPAAVLGGVAPPLLTPIERRLELLAEAGLDVVIVEPFDAALAARSAEGFVAELLVDGAGVRGVVVGADFGYGRGRAGSATTLAAAGAAAGFTVDLVAPVVDALGVVSSTRVRACLAAGDVAGAAALLGRPWDVTGTVVHGAHRGRELGVPTANIAAWTPLPLGTGIYAGWLHDGEARRAAVASLGTNPTFVDGGPVVLEVHVLDWAGDLYGRRVRFEVTHRLRDEARYDGVEALLAQIRRDLDDARRVLAS